jgi:hypothetical protein
MVFRADRSWAYLFGPWPGYQHQINRLGVVTVSALHFKQIVAAVMTEAHQSLLGLPQLGDIVPSISAREREVDDAWGHQHIKAWLGVGRNCPGWSGWLGGPNLIVDLIWKITFILYRSLNNSRECPQKSAINGIN